MKLSKRLLAAGVLIFLVVFIPSLLKKPNFSPESNLSTPPAAAQTGLNMDKVNLYVSESYPGYTIAGTKQDPMCNGGTAFDVSIENSNKDKISLIFFPDGRFVQQEIDVEYKKVPTKVKNSIQTGFKDATASATVEQLTLANSQTEYLVDVVAKDKTTEVILDLSGNIICQG